MRKILRKISIPRLQELLQELFVTACTMRHPLTKSSLTAGLLSMGKVFCLVTSTPSKYRTRACQSQPVPWAALFVHEALHSQQQRHMTTTADHIPQMSRLYLMHNSPINEKTIIEDSLTELFLLACSLFTIRIFYQQLHYQLPMIICPRGPHVLDDFCSPEA